MTDMTSSERSPSSLDSTSTVVPSTNDGVEHLLKIRTFDTKQLQDPAESNDCTFSSLIVDPIQLKSKEIIFLEAARTNDVETVNNLLCFEKINVNTKNNLFRSALHLAAANGHLEVVKVLLMHRANKDGTDTFGMSPLMWAALSGHTEVVQELLKAKVNVMITSKQGLTVFHCVALGNQVKVLRLLLSVINVEKLEINKTCLGDHTPLHLAAERGFSKVVEELLKWRSDITIKNKIGQTALHVAAEGGHCSVLELLLNPNPELEVDGTDLDGATALILASAAGQADAAECLLQTGLANVDSMDRKGMTSLMHAAQNGHENVVAVLLRYNCDTDLQDEAKNTALHLAVSRERIAIIELLIMEKCDVTIVNNVKQTALHLAVELGNTDAVRALMVAAGPQLKARDGNGKTPLALAARADYPAIVDMLITYDRLAMLKKLIRKNVPDNEDDAINNTVVEPVSDGQYVDEDRVIEEDAKSSSHNTYVAVDSAASDLLYNGDSGSEGTLEATSNAGDINDIIDEDQISGSIHTNFSRQSVKSDISSLKNRHASASVSTDGKQADAVFREQTSNELPDGVDCQSLNQSLGPGETNNVLTVDVDQQSFNHSLMVGETSNELPDDVDCQSLNQSLGPGETKNVLTVDVDQQSFNHSLMLGETSNKLPDDVDCQSLNQSLGPGETKNVLTVDVDQQSFNHSLMLGETSNKLPDDVDCQSLKQSLAPEETDDVLTGDAVEKDNTNEIVFYTLPKQEHQPNFEQLLLIADRINQYEQNDYNDAENQQVDDETFPIIEISVKGGVCKVRETVGRDSRVNLFTGTNNSEVTSMSHTALSQNDDDEVTAVDEVTDDVHSVQHSCIDDNAGSVVSNCTSSVSEMALDDLPQVHDSSDIVALSDGENDASERVTYDQFALAAGIGPSNDNDLAERESAIYDNCSTSVIERTESTSSYLSSASHDNQQRHRERDSRGNMNGDEAEAERVMTSLLWKLAVKQLKPDDWKKLAKYWKFTTDHINAVQQQYTGSRSYRTHGYRLLTIWFQCQLHITKLGVGTEKSVITNSDGGSVSIFGQLFEALAAIGRRKLAEEIRQRCNKKALQKRKGSSCVIS